MIIDFTNTTLGEIAIPDYGLVDGPFGSNLPASLYTETGIPVVRGSNLSIDGTRFKGNEFVFVSEKTAQKLSRSTCRKDDIIFTKKGTLGQTGFIPNDNRFDKYLLSSNQMKLTVDTLKADPLYVYYFVSLPASREKIIRESTASGVPKTNVTYLKTFPISLPPLDYQKSVVSLLSVLDDKIELNHQMNHTLEQMAQSLYKSWFVDFDPVVAKAAGKKPFGMSDEVAALFPDRFVDSVLGEIPEGWEINYLRDIIELAYGKSLPEPKRIPGNTPVYGSKGQVGLHNCFLVKGPGIVVGRKGNAGAITWAPTDFFPIDTTYYVVLKDSNVNLSFTYYWLNTLDLENISGDSAVPGLNRELAYTLSGIIPNKEVVKAFSLHVDLWHNQIHNNDLESLSLTQLRDTLLPKLLSGEIRLKQAEKAVSEAV